MFQKIAKHIYSNLLNKKILGKEDGDVYIYALEVVILNTSVLAVLLGISACMGQIEGFGYFILFFVPLRIFAGGYHAKKSEICFLMSIISYCISLFIVKYYPSMYENVIIQMITFFILLMLFIYAPLVNENHPLDEVQYNRNRGFVRLLLVVDVALLLVLCMNDMVQGTYLMVFVLLNGTIFLIGKLKRDVLAKE